MNNSNGRIVQDNKKFFKSGEYFYVSEINGRSTTGRQGSYPYVMCDVCGKLVGTQFQGHLKHFATHNAKS